MSEEIATTIHREFGTIFFQQNPKWAKYTCREIQLLKISHYVWDFMHPQNTYYFQYQY